MRRIGEELLYFCDQLRRGRSMFESTTACILLLPLSGAIAIAFLKRHEILRNLAAAFTGGGAFILCGLLLLKTAQGPVIFSRPLFMGIGLHFKVDLFGALFAFFSALIWFLAILYSWGYMSHQQARTRYYIFLILTLGGCLGVFLAGDLFSLFLFFEMMSLTSYVLVIHNETEEAMHAGRNYLYFSIIGGLFLLTGILLLYSSTGTISLAPQLELLERSGPVRYYIAALMIAGFGIKAGMLPVHVWLPRAHPVAPSPASALLSGIMIKVGAYGIIRVFNLVLTPAEPEPGAWQFTGAAGYLIIWIAAATMLFGALMALFQSNMKRLLAYSSISQMGYILLGVGCAAYLGYGGTIGFTAFTYHILNHAFFKSGLFLMAGAIYARTGEEEITRLGGLARSSPVTAAAFFTAAAGLAGFPGFNGYISKTLLHHAVVEAAAEGCLATLQAAEFIFMLTGALTACYIFKLFAGIFTGPRPIHLASNNRETFPEQLIFAAFGAAIIYLGLFPRTVINRLILPATRGFILDGGAVAQLKQLRFMDAADLLGAVVPIFFGLALLYAIRSLDLTNKIKLPSRLSIDRLFYAPLSRCSLALFTAAGEAVEKAVDGFYLGVPVVCGKISRGLMLFEEHSLPMVGNRIKKAAARFNAAVGGDAERAVDGFFLRIPVLFRKVSQRLGLFEDNSLPEIGRRISMTAVQTRESTYRLWIAGLNGIFGSLSRCAKGAFRVLMRMDYRPQDSETFRTINISNLDFNIFFIMIYLILIMGILLLINT